MTRDGGKGWQDVTPPGLSPWSKVSIMDASHFENTDTPLPPDEPAGQNPPDGAVLHYFLKSAAQGPVTLEIVDAQGGIVRRHSSADPVEPLVEGRNTPDYWLRPHRPLAATAGLHRFVWDVHHERPAVTGFSYLISAVLANTPRMPMGSWAPPGKYSVRLTVDGKALTQPFTAKMDPRVKMSAADLKLQYELSRAIDASLRRSAAALRDIRATAANTAALTDLEQRLSRASAPLGQLFSAVASADAAPTPVVREAWKATAAAVDAAIAEWEKMKAGPR